MKRINLLCLIFVLLSTYSISQQKNDTVYNNTIIKMYSSKLSDKIILQKINTNLCKFDVSTDALIELKQNGISDEIVNLMVDKQTKNENIKEQNTNSNNDGKGYYFKSSGIYFKKGKEYVLLDQTIVTSSTGSAGLTNVKYLSQIEGKEANYLFNELPSFYFNFITEKKELNNSNANPPSSNNDPMQTYLNAIGVNQNQSATSPNEFKLVKLKVSKGKREYLSGKINALGKVDFSIGDKYLVSFKYEKVSENTYKVILPSDLKPGEYCFLYLNNNANNNPILLQMNKNSNKVYDFGFKISK